MFVLDHATSKLIQTGRPTELDLGEPARVAEAVAKMGLKHCVITSVTRDELADGGASVWAATVRAIRNRNPGTAIEVLTPDFRGNLDQVDTVLESEPDIFNHNVETVERLQKPVRVQARYLSLALRFRTRRKGGIRNQVRNHAGPRRNREGNHPNPTRHAIPLRAYRHARPISATLL